MSEPNQNNAYNNSEADPEYPQEILLKGYGKWIDTTPLRYKLTQGESLVNAAFFYLDRYSLYRDLRKFLFVMRGILPSGKQVETVLNVNNDDAGIVACWNIKKEFTEEAGEVLLDLSAYAYENTQKNTEFLASETWVTKQLQ